MGEQERLDVEVELKLIKERARRPSPCFEQFCSRSPCSPVSRTLSELFYSVPFPLQPVSVSLEVPLGDNLRPSPDLRSELMNIISKTLFKKKIETQNH